MRVAINDFAKFYQSQLGQLAATIINNNIAETWKDNKNQNILGFGFTAPIISRLEHKDCRLINFVIDCENENKDLLLAQNNWVIGEETRTPFFDDFFHKIVCLNGLEESENPQRTLRELWRILAPEGSLVLIVPNRRGVWARLDNTPFGQGRPFSRSQLLKLTDGQLFETVIAKRILYAPPFEHEITKKIARHFEAVGARIWPTFGGLLFFELKKRVLIAPPTDMVKSKPIRKTVNASIFSKLE